MENIKIFLTNLGRYNEVYLDGQWVTLPISQQNLERVFAAIGINEHYEEVFISDYETILSGLHIGEYSSLSELNAFCELLDSLTEGEIQTLDAALLLTGNNDVGSAINLIENLDSFDLYPDIETDEDIGYYYAEELGLLDGVAEHLKGYFNMAQLGRDIRFESNSAFTHYGYVVDNR